MLHEKWHSFFFGGDRRNTLAWLSRSPEKCHSKSVSLRVSYQECQSRSHQRSLSKSVLTKVSLQECLTLRVSIRVRGLHLVSFPSPVLETAAGHVPWLSWPRFEATSSPRQDDEILRLPIQLLSGAELGCVEVPRKAQAGSGYHRPRCMVKKLEPADLEDPKSTQMLIPLL